MTEEQKNKQKAALKVSLIPLVILILIILGVGYFLLQGEITLPKFNRGPTLRRLEGFSTVIYSDRVVDKQRKIIKSEQELNEFLNFVDPSGLLQLKDKINFEKEFIIAVTSSTNNESDHKIKIRKVYEDKEAKKIIVLVEETNPGETCKIALDKNITLDMVALSKTDWQIKFDKVTKVEECKN